MRPARGRDEEPVQIVIRADGRVTFGLLTDDLLAVAQALAPGDPRLRTRRARAAPRGKEEGKP